MKRSLALISLALWSSLDWGLTCSPNEYPFSNTKCCKNCPAGEQLVKRCTDTSPTVCESCDENYYNEAYTYSWCKPCTDCNADRGLQEIRPCQATSNTVCACLPGHAPEESQEEKRCNPCPSGYFSLGGNEKCRPWTKTGCPGHNAEERDGNTGKSISCTASGRKILRSGKQDADTICDKPSSKFPTEHTVTWPTTPFLKKTNGSTMKLDSSPIVVPTNPGFVWILITFVPLLTVAGILVVLFFYRRTKKKKLEILCNGIYAVPCKDEENDYRMPIQEQEIGDKSDFVQG